MPLISPHEVEPSFVAEGEPLPPADDRPHPRIPARLAELYKRQRPRLLGFLRRRAPSESVDDLVQQTFVRFIAAEDARGEPIACPEGYLRQTARNLAIDGAKIADRRSQSRHVPLDEVELRAPDQIAALEARDMLHRLEAALLRLKPRTREIFLAHRIDGYSYAEIAARTGLSVKGVEKHMSRAIAHIDRVLSAR